MDLNDLNDPLMLALKKERVRWLQMMAAMGEAEPRHTQELAHLKARIHTHYVRHVNHFLNQVAS